MNVDYIIIGQGLSGSAVAIQLLRRGKKILVVDAAHKDSASRVAAGLFNPITGRKMVKTWMADKLFSYLHYHYRDVEALTGEKFFYSMPLYRPFISVEEQNEWMAKSAEASYESYIENVFTHSTVGQVKDEYGGILLKQCGYVDTNRYLQAVRKLIERDAIFLEEEIRESDIIVGKEGVQYKNFSASGVILCNGTYSSSSFNWLPVRPLKGETIRIEADYNRGLIINRGVYIVPSEGGREWRVGATYDQADRLPGITEKGKKDLIEKTGELITFPFIIVHQEYGFRPTTPDRRPLLGRHPVMDRMFTFNGMGTKGISLTPYFSDVLIRFIENHEPLNKEVDIERYKLLYWSSPK